MGIAGAVPPFVVVVDQRRQMAQPMAGLEKRSAQERMALYNFVFDIGEAGRFVQDLFGDADLANVMQKCPAADVEDFLLPEMQRLSKPYGDFRYAAAVSLGFPVAQVQRVR